MPGVRTLIVTDAEGTISASNQKQLIGLNFREREYFQAARQGLNPVMLYISPPFKSVLGVYAMYVAKVVLDAQGTFDGIVSAALDPDVFSVLLNSVLYAPGMRASLIHVDADKSGETAPEPLGLKKFKGNLTLRIPSEKHRELAIRCARGRSFTEPFYPVSSFYIRNVSRKIETQTAQAIR